MPSRLLACLTATAAGATVLLAAGHATAATPPTPCSTTDEIRIDALAFDPPEIAPGDSSAATLSATNCTGATQAVTETWLGTWLSSSATGIPSGCPVIDPLARAVTFAPHQQVATTTSYLVFGGCTADALRLTVRLTQGGKALGQKTADLIIDQP